MKIIIILRILSSDNFVIFKLFSFFSCFINESLATTFECLDLDDTDKNKVTVL